ncbi:MAG: DUF2007 domain-containing protein [Dethiobacter sp.]|jgi:hypothetical protein|nr:DUF2007 domain-containing protein [Dethiobacter sp.]
MFCPKCGDEFIPRVKECPDCNVSLIEKVPKTETNSNPEYVELVTVLVTRDMGELMIAKSLLEAEGIYCFAKGEKIQNLFGYGSLGAGYNLLVGPVQLQVADADANDARAILGKS